jgi:hypothetical protein
MKVSTNNVRTNTIRTLLLCVTLLASSAFAAVDPGLLSLVMPDAKVLTGVQVAQAEMSPLGQYVLTKTQFDDAKLLEIMAATGFDPRHDLKEVLAASSTDLSAAAVFARGTFQPSKMAAAATAHGGSTTQYRGFTVVLAEANGQGAIAFFDSSLAVLGSQTSVQAAIDRRLGGSSFSGPLAQKAQAISATNHAWFATVSPLSDFLAGKATDPNMNSMFQSNLLQAVQEASGGLQFGTTAVTFSGIVVARTDKDAQALGDVLKFLVSMLQNNAQNPASSLANQVQISTSGSTLNLSLSIPEQQAEQLFMPSATAAKSGAKKKGAR